MVRPVFALRVALRLLLSTRTVRGGERLDRFRADRLRDQQRGPRGTELAIGMSDLLAFASYFQAHAPEGVLAA